MFASTPLVMKSTKASMKLESSFVGKKFVSVAPVAPVSQGQRSVTVCAAKVVGLVKLALDAGKANPAPPVGPALGSKGVNIMAFCKEYNARTADKAGQVIPVEITVYDDRSFTFVLKTPPTSKLIMAEAKIKKGSANPKKDKVGKITMAQVTSIAKIKLPDLNCTTMPAAEQHVMGTMRNMGVELAQ